MLLTDAPDIPVGKDWLYETKYDGFRCILEWESEPILKSRNGKILNAMFPEIINFCHEIDEQISPFLPLTLDGELVYLTNNFQSNFSIVQLRGRMRNEEVIQKHVQDFPCHYVLFDLLKLQGTSQTNLSVTKRKQIQKKFFRTMKLPVSINYEDSKRIQAIDVYQDSEELWNKILSHNGEGIVAKRKTSTWLSGTRTNNWLKIKNWRIVTVILTKFDKSNGFFDGAVFSKEGLVEVVTFQHGLKEEESNTLKALFQTNGTKIAHNIWEIEPSICVEIACIDFAGEKLREPKFHAFNFEKEPADCNWSHMLRQLHPIPIAVEITHPDKPVWPSSGTFKR